ETTQHVEYGGALVVDERAEHAALAADVAEPVAEIDRTLLGLIHAPPAHLPQHRREHVVSALALRVHRGEVLREAFAQPLLVIVPPADRLSPPLMRELVRDEEVGEAAERGRIVAPHERRRRQRL